MEGLRPVLVSNIQDIQRVDKQNELAVFASVGLKNKIEMAKKAKDLGIKTNFNLNKFLQKAEKRAEWIKKERKGEKTPAKDETKKDQKEHKTENKEHKEK